MKSMIYQFYNEGFATTFCIKPINFIKKKVKNKKLIEFLVTIVKTIYTILALLVLIFAIYIKFFK